MQISASWMCLVIAGLLYSPALSQLQEISPAREVVFSNGFQVVSKTGVGAEVKDAKPAGARATVKAAFIGEDGQTYYLSDWSWERRQEGKSHFWIRPNQSPDAGPDEDSQVLDEVREISFPEGYQVVTAKGAVVKTVPGPATANIKAIYRGSTGGLFYLSDWSWEQTQQGKAPNWIVSIEGAAIDGPIADATTGEAESDVVLESRFSFDVDEDSRATEKFIRESWQKGDWAQAADHFADGHDFRGEWLEIVAAVAVEKGAARKLIAQIDRLNTQHVEQAEAYDIEGMSHEALCERQSIESNNRFAGILSMRLGDYAEVIRRNLAVAGDQSEMGFQGSGRRINTTREIARAQWRLGNTDEATVTTRRWLHAVAFDLAARIIHPHYLSSSDVIHQSNPENEPLGGYFELLGDISEPQVAAELLVCLKGLQLTAASFQHTTLADLKDPAVASEARELRQLMDRAQKLDVQGESIDEDTARRIEAIHAKLAFRKLNSAVVNLADSAEWSLKRTELAALSREEEKLQASVSKDGIWERLAKVQEEIFRLESEIDRITTEFAMKEGRFVPSPDDVIDRLESGELLLDFFHTGDLTKQDSGDSGRYGVLIFTKNRPVRQVDLGPANYVNAEIHALHTLMASPKSPSNGDAALQGILTRIHTALLSPVWQEIGGAEKVIICADAELSLLPFDCLLDANGKFAGEQQVFSYVNASRDLLRGTSGEWAWPSTKAFLVGNPHYASTSPASVPHEERSTGAEPAPGVDVDSEKLADRFKTVRFRALPGTQKEADEIAALLSGLGATANRLTGDQASESMVVASIGSPEIFHLATHGFFLGESKPIGTLDSGLFGPHDALLRGGVALAGAQRTVESWRAGIFPEPANDGILTAAEISRLDLGNTRLAVLSACQTGLGQLAGGECVTGLRSAIHVAGAHNVVLTLWEIPDLDTVSLMNDFYEAVATGKPISHSLAETKRSHLRRSVDSSGLWKGVKRSGAFILTESR